MLMFKASKQEVINAPAERIFEIVCDISRHPELAGSGEVKVIRKVTEGPVKMGTKFEADEEIKMGPSRSKFTATSEVTQYDPPKVFSWTSQPPATMSPKMKRIQWWFRLEPSGNGTKVTHAVEVEPRSAVLAILMKPMYAVMRGGTVNKGMKRTLERLKQKAETGAKAPAA
ncbi:MAG: SRPBCC family protein [Chloroflexi bacterium]|nr:SRPBCC family protein [Chloroflexota bacterium]